jgi:hypothetical protein
MGEHSAQPLSALSHPRSISSVIVRPQLAEE